MKVVTAFLCCSVLGLSAAAQALSFPEWQVRSTKEIRLVPRYSDSYAVEALRDEDVQFRKAATKGRTPKQASDSLVELGFAALRAGDQVKAFHIMNQAYVVMPTNSETRRGFGGVFMSMLRPLEAHEWYEEGLQLDSMNAKLFRDQAEAFLRDRYEAIQDERPRTGEQHLDAAWRAAVHAYELDPEDNQTTYVMFVTHLLKMNCDKAWEYLDKCVAQRGRSIEDEYTRMLTEACKR